MDKLTTDFKDYLYERLQDPEAASEYLNAASESGDTSTFLLALRLVAESRGISQVALDAELNRESLYKMLSDQGNPRLSSMLAVFEAIGVQIQVKPLKSDNTTKATVTPSLVEIEEGEGESLTAQLANDEDYGSTSTSDYKSAAA